MILTGWNSTRHNVRIVAIGAERRLGTYPSPRRITVDPSRLSTISNTLKRAVFNIPRSTQYNQNNIHSSPRTRNSNTSLQDKRLDSHGPYHRAALAGIVVVEGVVGILGVGSPVTKHQSACLRKRKSKVRVRLGERLRGDVPEEEDRNRVVEEGSSRLGEGDCSRISVIAVLPSSSFLWG